MALTHIPAAFLAKFHALIDAKFFLFVVLLNITTLGQYVQQGLPSQSNWYWVMTLGQQIVYKMLTWHQRFANIANNGTVVVLRLYGYSF